MWGTVQSRPPAADRAPAPRARVRFDGARTDPRYSAPGSRADRAERQDRLLDDALRETFPASDPVSVAFVE
jgi:hypothetical protein